MFLAVSTIGGLRTISQGSLFSFLKESLFLFLTVLGSLLVTKLLLMNISFGDEVALDKAAFDVPLAALCIVDEGVLPLERMTQKGEGGKPGLWVAIN